MTAQQYPINAGTIVHTTAAVKNNTNVGYKVSKSKARPRTTLEEKIMILNYYHQSNKPQADTVDFFKNRYSISTSSFSEWLKDEDSLRNLYNNSNEFLKKSKRKLRFKYDKINEQMDKLVEQRIKSKKPINEPFLRENWAIFANKYGVEDPKRLLTFSHGWLSQFKKRHGLDKQSRMSKSSSSSSSSNTVTISPESSNVSDTSSNASSTETLVEINDMDINNFTSMKPSLSTQLNTGNFLGMETNEDYMNLQTNITNYESLINNTSNFMPNQPIPSLQPRSATSSSVSLLGAINPRQYTTLAIMNSMTPESSGATLEHDIISEGDFEVFLNKYGEEFLSLNQDKYPESLKLLNELRYVFKKEKEAFNDKKLRELLFRRQ